MTQARRGALAVLMMGVLAMAGAEGAAPRPELPPRDYHIETTLARAGKAQAVIVSSSRRPAYAAIAVRVQKRIRELSGVAPDILDAEQATTDSVLASSSAIVLGNLATSRFVETLYWEWYTLLDLWYPGPGGHIVRTLHDPYGTGRNVVFLGGSDDKGVAAAADAFCRVLAKGEPLEVGRLMDIHLGSNHTLPPAGERTDPRLRIFHQPLAHRNVHECPLGYTDASLAALRYHYNGDEAALKRFRELALNTNVLSSTYHYYAHLHPILWDLVEEAPLFSDDDRRKITAKLLVYARGGEGTAGRKGLLAFPATGALLDRHAAMHANCTLTHSRYFHKYWPSDEWKQNLDAVRVYFDRSMTSAKGWRDEGNMHTYLECPLIAALLLRDRRLLDSGALRHNAEIVLMFCDNRGIMTTNGFGSYPDSLLRICAAVHRDPGFLATMPRLEEMERSLKRYPVAQGFTQGQAWDVGLTPEPMAKMIGVYHRPLTRWQWEWYGKGIAFEKGLDKLTMRSGFGRDDQYLLLDGISVGGGKPHPNRNAILTLCQRGYYFLYGSTHSLVVSRDGFGQAEGQIVSLEGIASLPAFGYSHTRAADHPFAAWDRHIFWRKGKWFVVLDRATAKQAGQHSITCNWDGRGAVRLAGSDTTITRGRGDAAATLHITNAERLRCARSGPRIRQATLRPMKPGDQATVTNLLYVESPKAPASYAIAKVADQAAALTGGERAYVGVTRDGAFERGGVALRGAAFCISPASVAVIQCTELRWGTLAIEASAPCNLELDPAAGRLTVEATAKLSLTLAGATHALEPGTHTLAAPKPSAELVKALGEAIGRDAAAPRPEPPAIVPKGLPALPVAWSHKSGAYTAYHLGDVDADGKPEAVFGTKDGRVVCLDAAGKVAWDFKVGGRVQSLAHATLDAGRAVLAGSDDEHVYAIAADGAKLLWKHKCHFSEERYNAAPWWTTGGKAKVMAICPVDLDGDGKAEIVCGTGAAYTEVLSSAGKRQWVREFIWGVPDQFAAVPMPDGSKTLLVNAVHACGSHTKRLDANGKVLTQNAFPTGRGSWDSTKVLCCEVADLDGKGTRVAIIGRGGAFNELALHDAVTGKRRWCHPMANSVTGVAAADLDGDGVKEIVAGSTSTWLSAFAIDGKLVWATQLPNEILAVAATANALFAQCSDGVVYRLSFTGKLTGRHTPEHPAPPSLWQRWPFRRAPGLLLIGDHSGTLAPLALGGSAGASPSQP